MVKTGRKTPVDYENVAAINLNHVTEIENPTYLKQKIQVDAIVSSTFRSYAVPRKVRGYWYDKEGARHESEKDINIFDPINMKFAGANSSFKQKTLAGLFLEAGKNTNVLVEDLEYNTIYSGRIRPPIFTLEKLGDKIVDEQGYEYKDYQVFIVSETQLIFPASTLMTLTGYVLPDPNTQRTTILATEVMFPEAVQNYDPDALRVLGEHFHGWTVEQRADWILCEFEKYSNIVGRRNIASATFLGFFTPTYITLNGETQRGWANILLLGDSTTGKTETVRKSIKLLRAGAIITAETASAVGLVGAATQIDKGGWSVDWGFLVLNDRKLLSIDGAQKLYKSQWAALAESERSGIVTIAKAAKDTAYARTRQIKVANPVETDSNRIESKNLAEFFYPVQGAASFLDMQNVARLDLCVFADSGDVEPTAINKQFTDTPDDKLHLLSEAVKWAWSSNAKHIFTTEALETLLSKATELYNKFFDKRVPLVSIDVKWKLARLSASLATLTHSTEDYVTITITEDHVAWVAEFLDDEYTNAGLDQLVQHSGDAQTDDEAVETILTDLGEALGAKDDPDTETAYKVLTFIALQGAFKKDQLKYKFQLSENSQMRPLLAKMNDHKLVKQGRGYTATSTLNKFVRYVEANREPLSRLTPLTWLKKTPPKNMEAGA